MPARWNMAVVRVRLTPAVTAGAVAVRDGSRAEVRGNERRRARGVDAEGGALEVEAEREPARRDAERRARGGVRLEIRRVISEQSVVVHVRHSRERPALRIFLGCVVSEAGFESGDHDQALLRISDESFTLGHPEELGVKQVDILEQTSERSAQLASLFALPRVTSSSHGRYSVPHISDASSRDGLGDENRAVAVDAATVKRLPGAAIATSDAECIVGTPPRHEATDARGDVRCRGVVVQHHVGDILGVEHAAELRGDGERFGRVEPHGGDQRRVGITQNSLRRVPRDSLHRASYLRENVVSREDTFVTSGSASV